MREKELERRMREALRLVRYQATHAGDCASLKGGKCNCWIIKAERLLDAREV